MATRLGALAPRVIAVALVILFATATLTFAAATQMSTPAAAPATQPAKHAMRVVPDVTGQAYVFAKGMLEDAGFAWRLGQGSKGGYAGYRVISQYPEQGTRVVDNGAPTVVLQLVAAKTYNIGHHTPDAGSPYAGKPVLLAAAATAQIAPTPLTPHRPATHVTAKPAAKTAVKPQTPGAKPVVSQAKPTTRSARTPAFTVANAPHEPLDEMSLPDRARVLASWVAAHHDASASNVHHWIYQHEWITTGAKFGWWRGAQALRILIGVDRLVEGQWNMGSQSEADARQALSFVEARSK